MNNAGARCGVTATAICSLERVRAGHCDNIQRRITRAKRSMRKSVLLLLVAALLPACGLKGPLYLPAQKPAANPPAAAAPAPGVQPDDKQNPAKSP